MGLRLFFWTNFPGGTFIQGATFILEYRVVLSSWKVNIAENPIALMEL